MKTLQRTKARMLVLALLLGVLGPFTTAVAEASPAAEQRFVDHINRERQDRGLPALQVNIGLRNVAQAWSSTMSSENRLYHNPSLATQVSNVTGDQWTRLAENVGRTRLTGATHAQLVDQLHRALMDSSGHRANILGAYNQVGVGVTIGSDGTMWVTQVFLHGSMTWGKAIALSGDWNGDGRETPGRFQDGRVYLRNSNSAGPADIVFNYGRRSDVPVAGDWNGNGIDTLGVRRGSTWYLTNRHAAGAPAATFNYGRAADVPVVGDWNGNGRTTVGVVRASTWYLSNRNAAGAPAATFNYGHAADVPVVGDWNGTGHTTVGVVRGSTWYLTNRNAGGAPAATFDYGRAADVPVAGDWNRNRRSGPGVVRGSTWYLRNETSTGSPHGTFAF